MKTKKLQRVLKTVKDFSDHLQPEDLEVAHYRDERKLCYPRTP